MLFDSLDNIEIYKGLSEDIYEGLKFLKQATPDLPCGIHEINPRVKAIVSEYETKEVNDNGFEAHRKNIDIQALLQGTERIAFLPVTHLTETKPYDPATDATFYSADDHPTSDLSHHTSSLLLQSASFAIFFPHDAHMPCLSVTEPMTVKKVVIKVKVV